MNVELGALIPPMRATGVGFAASRPDLANAWKRVHASVTSVDANSWLSVTCTGGGRSAFLPERNLNRS